MPYSAVQYMETETTARERAGTGALLTPHAKLCTGR